jgi:hypothetical protein
MTGSAFALRMCPFFATGRSTLRLPIGSLATSGYAIILAWSSNAVRMELLIDMRVCSSHRKRQTKFLHFKEAGFVVSEEV